ncbi:MAG: phosphatase PAP2 family protein [Gammaproteobacteria bacterium]|nr:phosphatase PAP2 family protein [Gammaproteobacteria bacterium]
MHHKAPKDIYKFTAKTFFIILVVYAVFFAFLDIPTARFSNLLFTDSPAWYAANIVSLIFSPLHWFVIGILALIIGAMQTYWRKSQISHAILLFGLSIIISYIACGILKVVLGRYRPEMLFFQGQYGFHFFSLDDSMHSSPSGHTATAFAGFFAASLAIPSIWLRRSLIGIACLIGLCRIISLEHYPSDVILGAYIGILSVYWAEFFLPKLYASLLKAPIKHNKSL